MAIEKRRQKPNNSRQQTCYIKYQHNGYIDNSFDHKNNKFPIGFLYVLIFQ
jgi:hypothetical protein